MITNKILCTKPQKKKFLGNFSFSVSLHRNKLDNRLKSREEYDNRWTFSRYEPLYSNLKYSFIMIMFQWTQRQELPHWSHRSRKYISRPPFKLCSSPETLSSDKIIFFLRPVNSTFFPTNSHARSLHYPTKFDEIIPFPFSTSTQLDTIFQRRKIIVDTIRFYNRELSFSFFIWRGENISKGKLDSIN